MNPKVISTIFRSGYSLKILKRTKIMARIELTELTGADLFSSEENFMDSMRDLTADELKISGGSGHKCKSGKSKKGCKSGGGGGCGCGGYC
jgi:hypothetical protein